jgi:pimeloyl-ACP methyl ester carboxylesterase
MLRSAPALAKRYAPEEFRMTDTTARRRELYGLLGDLPARDRPISAGLVTSREEPGYLLDTLILDLNGIEAVPAYLARPKETSGPVPAVLYHHAHGGDYALGKDELVRGRSALQAPPWAEVLTGMGIAVLCADTWAFGERRGRTEGEIFRQMLWDGRVMWGMMVYDSIRALDVLASHPGIDEKRLGTMGLSMGSTMAWWLAALDPRVKVCIDICCLTDFDEIERTRNLEGHGVYYYVPSLRKHFTAGQINALIAPRPHLGMAGINDRLTPPAGLDRIDHEVTAAYMALDAGERWKLSRHACGHMETATMRAEATAFLRRWL